MNRSYTILVDTREQRPLPFPPNLQVINPALPVWSKARLTLKISTVPHTLLGGDYALLGHERGTVIERKADLKEVAHNCLTKDRTRFRRALEKFRACCSNPILLLEGDPVALTREVHDMDIAIDVLFALLREHGIGFCTVVTKTLLQRQAAARLVAKLLISGAQP